MPAAAERSLGTAQGGALGPHAAHRVPVALCTLTYPARGADADEGDAGAPGVVQQLDELVQHDGDGGDAHPVLEPGRNASVTLW